jgi:hypothetical protein
MNTMAVVYIPLLMPMLQTVDLGLMCLHAKHRL